MNCLICGNTDIKTVDTIVSDFVMARINPHFLGGGIENYKTKLCFCKKCSFAFYDYRINDQEDQRLYKDYRGLEYQKVREKYECWYTRRVNHAMNNDEKAIREQKKVIECILKKNIEKDLEIALDYGGNEGKTYTQMMGTKEKYVFDISGVDTIKGVKNISSYEELKNYSFDFIMCNHLFEHLANPMDIMERLKEIGCEKTIYYIEVPSENPFTKKNKFAISNNLSLMFNPNYNPFRLVKYYFQQRRKPFMPMKEHINFFTKESIRAMVENKGFCVIDVQENEEKSALGKSTVLSVLFRFPEKGENYGLRD